MEDKYIATFLLHALGDTIGFKNGDWEFFPQNNTYGATLNKLYEFIDLGGISGINLENWLVSDDTILHMAIARSLILSDYDKLLDTTTTQIIKVCQAMKNDEANNKNRFMGNAVVKHVNLILNGTNWKTFNFDKMGGGNGAAMRNNCIGLAFFGEENRDKLIDYAIMSSKITHINPIGWLGGLSTALFTAFALEHIDIIHWVPKLLDLITSNRITKLLDKNNTDEISAYEIFVQCWKTYYNTRFENKKPIKLKSHTNLIQRLVFYNSIFDINTTGKSGLSGYGAVIVAYDCLLDAGNNWEKLVIYAMINNFDSDTIGAIAAGLFGTLYGLKNVPIKNLQFIEFKDKLIKLGKLLYKKYYKHEKLIIS